MVYLLLLSTLTFLMSCNNATLSGPDYPAPIINSVSPTLGLYNSSQLITITGEKFVVGSTYVSIGGQACTIVSINETNITCMSPSFMAWPGIAPVVAVVKKKPSVSDFSYSLEVLLGQDNYTTRSVNKGGVPAAATMSRPYSIDTDGTRLALTDYNNNRVLLWNSIPTSVGQPADVIIGQATASDVSVNRGGAVGPTTLYLPRHLKFYGTKLFIVDSFNNRVLIWNTFPVDSNDEPDVVIGQTDFISNGGGTLANKFSQPACLDVDSNGRLYVSDAANNRVLIWNSIPTDNTNPNADIVLGQSSMTAGCINNCDILSPNSNTFSSPRMVKIVGNELLVVDHVNHRVLIWNDLPLLSNEPADIVLGQPTMTQNTQNNGGVSEFSLSLPTDTKSTGDDLIVSDYGNHRILFWENFPVSNNEPATHVIGQSTFGTNASNRGLPVAKDSLSFQVGITVLGKDIVVADSNNHRVLLLQKPVP